MKVKTTAENRKDVVKAIEEILNVKAKYQGPPSFGYKVGEYTVDRDGNVEHESEEAALTMQKELVARGLAEGEADRLNIGIPIEGFTAEGIKNLIYMIHSKQCLLEKAVGKEVFRISDKLVERLDAEENIPLEKVIQIAEEESIEGLAFEDDRICFCGFPLNEDEARAYAELAACMAKTAKEAKRVSPKATIEENEKYYMRVWLVRIGLGGKDGKDTRKVFLSRLKGHTAFRIEEDKEKWKERNSKKSTESAEYCQAYARWKEAEEFITQHGTIVKTPSGYWQQVPQVSIAQTYLKIMNKFCEQFGLTPSARSRIVADTAEDKESDAMELLLIKGGGR